MIAQCPHCGSRFRVTDRQLDQAQGRARCGACLEIFQAAENLMPEAGGPADAPSPDGPAPEEAATGGSREAVPVAATPVAADPGGNEAAARDSPGGAIWVRWALALAVLALIGQLLWHLGYIDALR